MGFWVDWLDGPVWVETGVSGSHVATVGGPVPGGQRLYVLLPVAIDGLGR
jgi:hypothetical protein